ncbi:MAG: hypothetical protein ACO1G9_05600 [Bacteroidota bacterium]
MILSSVKKKLAKAGVLLTFFLPSAKADGNKKVDDNKGYLDYFSFLVRGDLSAITIGIESCAIVR